MSPMQHNDTDATTLLIWRDTTDAVGEVPAGFAACLFLQPSGLEESAHAAAHWQQPPTPRQVVAAAGEAGIDGPLVILADSQLPNIGSFGRLLAERPASAQALLALGQGDLPRSAQDTCGSGWWWPAEQLEPTLLWLSPALWQALVQTPESDWSAQSRLWRECGHRLLVSDRLVAGSGARLDRVSRSALAADLRRLPEDENRPLLLHVCHGWGGGIRRWINDMASGDQHYRHLLLASYSEGGDRRAHGQWLQLREPNSDALLAEWPLQAPIQATAIEHEGHRQVLADVLREHGVAAVLVSSLIGHSLAALETGLPTVFVAHDAWPACSAIHAYFDEPCPECPRQRLQRCLSDNPHNRLFASLPADFWLQLRQQALARMQANRVKLVAPSQAMLERLLAIDSEWQTLGPTIIGHGIDWPTQPEPPPAARPRPRVVVLGRVQATKGSQLLLSALPEITRHADVWLLGCGIPALPDVLGQRHVHVLTNYRREQLPALLAEIAPDMGLLLSTVPESFGYTLSEFQAAGIAVLATRLGAYVERIADGENGFLVEPQAQGVSARLAQLLADPGALQTVRHQLTKQRPDSIEQMREQYRQLLSQVSPLPAPMLDDAGRLAERSRFAAPMHEAQQALASSRAALEKAEREVIRRGNWGGELQQQVNAASSQIRQQEQELLERLEWARSLQGDIVRLEREQRSLQSKQQETQDWALSVARRNADLEAIRLEHAYMINSYSWKLMRPVRVVNRGLRKSIGRLRHTLWRLRMLLGRTRLSLRTRGLSGTVSRVRDHLSTSSGEQPATPLVGERVQNVALSALERVVFDACQEPEFSIVIPVFNQRHHTHGCLQSIARTCHGLAVEVIVVDDCSGDDTAAMIEQRTNGVKLLRNEVNSGFIRSCNRGAAEARGRWLVLLNNDTEVCEGWLQAMRKTFDEFDDCAMVGAQLLYPDGALQEAGGIVFANGNAWNYGRDGDARAPMFNFAREVDYCSGACLMLETELFNRLGGFDLHYLPAYYEDTDLAFRLRALGKRVIYQPAAKVVHFEGVSNGTETDGGGIKRYQAENRLKFEQRWAEALARQPMAPEQLPEGQFNVHAAANFRARRRILIVDATTPTPDQDSGSLRMVNLIRIFQSLGYQVSFLPSNLGWELGYSDVLQALGVQMIGGVGPDQVERWLVDHGPGLDAVMLSRHYVASEYLERVRRHAPQARYLFDTVDLHYLREQRQAELMDDPALMRIAEQTREAEMSVARQCDQTLVVSSVEKALLADTAPDISVAVLSNIHQVHGCSKGYEQRQGILFVGGYQHPPNVDAVCWFVESILPSVRERLPEVEFHIVGSKAPESVKRLGELPGVVFHGFVEQVEPFLENCRIAVAPLRYGAGVKGKVNMSMAWGQPVVVTTPAAEGMYLRHGEDALVADSAADFADAVVAGYGDAELWQRLSENGLANVERYFSFAAARRALQQILPD